MSCMECIFCYEIGLKIKNVHGRTMAGAVGASGLRPWLRRGGPPLGWRGDFLFYFEMEKMIMDSKIVRRM